MVTTERRARGARWSATLFILCTLALAALLAPSGAAAGAAGSAAAPTFGTPCFTPAAIHNGLPPQQTSSYTVPATGVTTVRAVLRGQNGGRGGYSGGPYTYNGGTDGGLGSTLVVEVPVTPGQVLHVGRLTGAPGGSAVQAEFSGGKGGDAQYLSTAGADGCQHALAVAGGGGGGGGKGARGGNADAGAGATGGQNGGNNTQEDGGGGGGAQATIGGTPGARGTNGAFSFSECNDGKNGRWGEFLTGGDGANAPDSKQTSGGTAFPVNSGCAWSSFPGGGGGGGGYRYGGGGGSPFGHATGVWDTSNAGGGGGGSSYLDPSATKLSLSAGTAGGDPLVVPVYFTGMTFTSTPNPSIGGNAVTITATVLTIGANQPVPSGTVDIYVGATPTTVQVGTNGKASLTTTTIPVGTTILRAVFNDTTTSTAAYRTSYSSGATYYQTVNPCASAPTIRDQPWDLTAVSGTSVNLTIAFSVAPTGGSYYGIEPTVQWQISTDGGTTWSNIPSTNFTESSPSGAGPGLVVYTAYTPAIAAGTLRYRAIATTCGGTTTSNAATLTVKGIAFDLTGVTKSYGDIFDISSYAAGSSAAVSFKSDTATTCTVAGTTVTLVGAGTCTITAEQAKPLTDPLLPPVQRSFTVQKKVLTVVAGSPPSQPQGTASAPTVICTANFVGGDTFVTAPISGVYVNIILSDGTNMLRRITVGASTAAGNYITQCPGGNAGANYTIGGYTKGTFKIGPPAPPTLTITATDHSYTYGTTPPALDATYSSTTIARSGTLACNVYAKSDTGYASPLTLAATTPVVAGGYAIRCSGITSANPVAWANGTLTVNPATVDVTASSPAAQTYGATAAPSVTCAATGFVGADSFVTSPTGAVYDLSGTNQVAIGPTASAGEYVTKCAGGDPGSNYTISGYTPGTFTVRDTTAPAISGTPSDQTAEATGPDGAVVTYTIPTANDLVDGSRTVTCAPAAGGTFAIGATTVTCSASDTRGNSASTSFAVTVRDTAKPVVTIPTGITAEATSVDGAVATFNATATDAVTANLTVSCMSAPGSTFKLGDTTVTCSATDAAGNTGSAVFTVTVRDTTPPDTSLTGTQPANPTKQTGASFTFSGTDSVGVARFECTLDGGAFAACTSPKSYSGLAEGRHTFQVRARDAAGNATQTPASHTWTIDTTSPVITVANVTVNATSPAGATVPFTPTATDANPASPVATCTPASGGTFGIGTTTVNCSATDAAGNTGTARFTVTVQSASAQLTDLQAKVQSLPLEPTTRKNLQSILQNAQAAAGKGDIPGACDKLSSFISQVQAQSGKKIATPTADGLLVDARRIMAVLGCS